MNLRISLFAAALLLMFADGAKAVNCNIATTPVNFGFYDLLSTTDLNSAGSVTVTCNNPARRPLPVTVSLSAGSSGSFGQRRMSSTSGGALYYNLYTDAAKTVIFGDGSGGSVNLTTDMSKVDPFNIAVYGRIPALQNVVPGVYSDILTATVIW